MRRKRKTPTRLSGEEGSAAGVAPASVPSYISDAAQAAASPLYEQDSKRARVTPEEGEEEETVGSSQEVSFVEVLKGLGLRVAGEGRVQYSVENAYQMQRQLTRKCRGNARFTEALVNSMTEHLEDLNNLRAMLLPMQGSGSTGGGGGGASGGASTLPDTLAKTLLGVPTLHEALTTELMDKIPMYAGDSDSVQVARLQHNIPKLVLNQFRWMSHLDTSSVVATKLLDTMSICPENLQREIVGCLPELVDDAHHAQVADALLDLVRQDDQFMVPVLDALASLSLKPATTEMVRTLVLQSLASSRIVDLPVMVRFLIQSVDDAESASVVVREIRDCLDIVTLSSLSSGRANANHEQRVGEAMTLEALRTGVRFNKAVLDAFKKESKGIRSAHELKVLDVWVLLVLLSMPTQRKAAERDLRSKVGRQILTGELLECSIAGHSTTLAPFFNVLLGVADSLMHSSTEQHRQFAQQVYRHAFVHFGSAGQRQEVVASIVTHMGSGNSLECDSALELLVELATLHPVELNVYAPFLKGVLEYLVAMSDGQMRALFRVFALLAYPEAGSGAEESGMPDDIHILVRKQLSNGHLQFRRIGVIAAVAFLARMGDTAESAKNASQLLGMLLETCETSASATSLLYDELARMVEAVEFRNEALLEEIFATATSRIEGLFVEYKGQEVGTQSKEAWMNLDNVDAVIAMSIMPHVMSADTSAQQLIRTAFPLFRLVQASCRRVHGNLEQIDAMLGCPMLMFDAEEVTGNQGANFARMSEAERHATCLALVHAINWCRELVNAFSQERNSELKLKVIDRMTNMLALEEMLVACLKATPSFDVTLGSDQSALRRGEVEGEEDEVDGEGEEEEERDEVVEGTQEEEEEEEEEEGRSRVGGKQGARKGTKGKGKAGTSRGVASVEVVRKHMREMDVHVSVVLTYNNIRYTVFDNSAHETGASRMVKLSLPVIAFVLEDLYVKVYDSLGFKVANYKNKRRVVSGEEMLEAVVPVVPHMCQHIDGLAGKLSGGGLDEKSTALARSAMHSVFAIVRTCLQSGQAQGVAGQATQHALLSALAGGQVSGETELEEVQRSAFAYLAGFSTAMQQFVTAYHLCECLFTIHEQCEAEETKDDLREDLLDVVNQTLRREWEGKPTALQLSTLVGMSIRMSKDALGSLNYMAVQLFGQVSMEDDEAVPEQGTLHKSSFPVYYRTAMETLTGMFAELSAEMMGTLGRGGAVGVDVDGALRRMKEMCETFGHLIKLARSWDLKAVTLACLKHARVFLEKFIGVMPFVSKHLKWSTDLAIDVIRGVQGSTRVLHVLCGHYKAQKDTQVVNAVPAVKRVMEALVYKVKAVMVEHKALSQSSTFTIGNLKHKGMQGEVLSSQVHVDEEDEVEEEEEEEEER